MNRWTPQQAWNTSMPRNQERQGQPDFHSPVSIYDPNTNKLLGTVSHPKRKADPNRTMDAARSLEKVRNFTKQDARASNPLQTLATPRSVKNLTKPSKTKKSFKAKHSNYVPALPDSHWSFRANRNDLAPGYDIRKGELIGPTQPSQPTADQQRQSEIARNVADYYSKLPAAIAASGQVQAPASSSQRVSGVVTDPVTGQRMGGISPIAGAFTNRHRDQLQKGETSGRPPAMGIGTQNLARGAIGTKQLAAGAFATPKRRK